MFYCDEDAEKRGWPTGVLIPRSYGRCEICGERRNCNDVPSSYLPAPRRDASTDCAEGDDR